VNVALMTEEELALRWLGVCLNGEEDGGASEEVSLRRRFTAGVAGVCGCGPLEKKDMRLFCLRFSLDCNGFSLDEDMAASVRQGRGGDTDGELDATRSQSR
jgi:hypothetical protein